MEDKQWILCPVCGSKTRLQIREDTILRNFPLYCPKCKQEREFTATEKEIIEKMLKKYNEDINLDNVTTYDAIGCKYCNNTGYYERIGVFEILDITEEIKELIVNGASSMEIRKKAIEQNYRPLLIDGIKKVIKGETTLEELNKKLLFF